MDASRPTTSEVPESGIDVVGLARRHWWLALLFVVLGLAGALQFTARQTKVYESSTSVLVSPTGTGQDTNVVGGRTKGDINLDTEAQLVRSTAVAADAAGLLRSPLTPDELAANVGVEVPANTSVLVITYSAADPAAAQAGSHAFAEAYLRNREETARAEVADQMATLDGKLKQLNLSLEQINGRLGAIRPDNPERANLESLRSTTSNQVNALAARLNQLATTTISAGKIIRDAQLPTYPSSPNRTLNLAGGAMIGLLLGVGAALLRDRLDKRVRRPGDLHRRTDMTVLAALPARVRPRLDDIFPPFGTGGRIFNRLRNEVLAAVPAPVGDLRSALSGQVVVVTGASRGAASTLVAANLAAAFARTGSETVLVCAHLPDSLVESASVNRMLGVRAVPGLSDVLAGRVPLLTATQRAPRHPSLGVITTGGTASAGGLLQSQALRDTLALLRERAVYVVIEAPSTATSADAQSLASLADAAMIAVELRRTTYLEVADAADQLRRVGTPLLGAVVLPRLGAARDPGDTRTEPGHAVLDRPVGPAPAPSTADDATVVMAKTGPSTSAQRKPSTGAGRGREASSEPARSQNGNRHGGVKPSAKRVVDSDQTVMLQLGREKTPGDRPKPDSPKRDSPKPDAPKPDALKPNSPKPDALKPDSLKSNMSPASTPTTVSRTDEPNSGEAGSLDTLRPRPTQPAEQAGSLDTSRPRPTQLAE